MILKIYEENPNPRDVRKVVDILRDGGVIIYPTDSVYGMGCDIKNRKAVEKVAQIKGIKAEKANFSFICYDLSHLSDFTPPLDNRVYKMMKRNLPGPFTFILDANNNVPKMLKTKKKTVGIRVPDNNIIREIVLELGNPVMNTSVYDDDEIIEYTTDPELIHEKYEGLVDLVVDGGNGNNEPTTVVNCSRDQFEIIREGIQELEY